MYNWITSFDQVIKCCSLFYAGCCLQAAFMHIYKNVREGAQSNPNSEDHRRALARFLVLPNRIFNSYSPLVPCSAPSLYQQGGLAWKLDSLTSYYLFIWRVIYLLLFYTCMYKNRAYTIIHVCKEWCCWYVIIMCWSEPSVWTHHCVTTVALPKAHSLFYENLTELRWLCHAFRGMVQNTLSQSRGTWQGKSTPSSQAISQYKYNCFLILQVALYI